MQPLDEEAFEQLAQMAPEALGGWLADHQPPTDQGREHWWEYIATRALQRVYYASGEVPADRLHYARLVAAVTDEAVRQGALRQRDGVMRKANLAGFYLRQPGCDVRDLADPDDLVRDALAAIPVPFPVAARDTARWTTLPIAEIANLRAAKNLLGSVAALRDHLRDDALRRELGQWLEIAPQLP
jgi:hypothetical protein